MSALLKWDTEQRSKPSYSEKSTHPSLKERLEYLGLMSAKK